MYPAILNHPQRFILQACVMTLIGLSTALSATAQGPIDPVTGMSQNYQFSGTDFVRARIGNDMKIRYFLGEPVVVPIILSNHTQYPITINTNFNPRSKLNVLIRQTGQPTRIYHGPFRPAIYTPREIFLYPLQEYTSQVVIWADIDSPTGFAFNEPGEYTLEFTLDIEVPEGRISGQINVGSVTIQIDPTPEDLQPLIESMKEVKAAVYIHHQTTPPGWGEQLERFINTMPITSLTPYLCLAYADYLQVQWIEHQDDEEEARQLADEALQYYQIAAKSDSAYKLEAYGALLRYLDRLGAATAASAIAEEMLDAMPKDRLGKIGSSPLLKKYLRMNTEELNPIQNWYLFP